MSLRRDPRARAVRPLVLLVDDEADILVALEDLLEDEFRVLSTTSPADALAILRREPDVSVIVSDQRMPGMNGDQFLSRARQHSDAQALLLTGYADLSAVVSAVNDGRISGYAHKPWEPAALLAMIRQAARRAELQDALRWERMLLQGLLDGSGDGVSIKDRDGRFLRLNRIAADRLGHEPSACLGRTEAELVPGTVGEAMLQADLRTMRNGAVATDQRQVAEDENRPASRGGRWLQRLRAPVRDADGSVAALATLERDISDEKAAEAQARQNEKMQALGTMAGGVAHDFNNLLTAVLGSLEMARNQVPPGEARLARLLDTAQAAADRGSALTQRLLRFSRQDDSRVGSFDVNELIGNMRDLLSRSVGRRDITIEYELAPSLSPVRADGEQLELALINLCVNARDAMPDGGRLVLCTTAAEVVLPEGDGPPPAAGVATRCVSIAVQDEGIGMSPELQQRIFEPFFTTKEIGRGTGLGLSTVYAFARQSGGMVLVDSAPGKGSRIAICLPSIG
ncbi:ATP-binding protein [Rhizosaccharibacter radicis]|uniref:histidine kinase n=1 Tax=Rhizosaccharibacter radicis TaxID=2782605 RepID=A0ABT1VX70_9PROT|nr:PAS domain-containing protein [Acetobacteraceae bacterium KSS12]